MIKGIGVDICQIDRIKNIELFAKKILCSREYELFENKTSHQAKAEFLAGRFAGKEACIKAMNNQSVLTDFEILNKDDGQPYVVNLPIHISISHEKEYAVAFAIVEIE